MEFVDVRFIKPFCFVEKVADVDALFVRNACGVWIDAEAWLPKDIEMLARRGSRPTEFRFRFFEIVGIR